jgi:hypothetical protein
LVAASLVAACTKPVPGVCCIDSADCATHGIDEVRSCSDGLVCIEHECSVPPPGTCAGDADCGSGAPHCTPDGSCVECVRSDQCTASAPICDDAAHACRGCASDVECDSGVCDVPNGTCALASDVAYASPGGSDAAACTQSDACSIVHAFAVTNATRRTVKLSPGNYSASITVAGKSVSVHGSGATVTAGATDASTFAVRDNASLSLQGLSVVKTGSQFPINCEGLLASLVIDEVDVAGDSGTIFARRCTVRVARSHLRAVTTNSINFLAVAPTDVLIDRTLVDGPGGIVADGSGSIVRITNSLVASQNSQGTAFGYSLFSNDAGVIFVSFSSVVDSLVKCLAEPAICTGVSAKGLCLDNTIIANSKSGAPADTVTGPGCISNYTLAFPQSTSLTGANNKIGVNPQLLDPINSDFHLKSSSPAIDAADPAATNPVDFDGVSRPQGAGRDLGAYELKP